MCKKRRYCLHTVVTAILELMQVPLQQKLLWLAEDGTLLYSFYSSNNGSPLATSIIAIKEIYEQLPADAHIVSSCSTGYGEALVKAALMLDEGEVETVAHYYRCCFL